MKNLKTLGIAFVAVAAFGIPVLAQDAADRAITARQSQMQLYAFNLGQLGAMAKGTVDYDADAATAAAGNLVKLTSLAAGPMWVPGSDNGAKKDTRALPAIWQNFPDVGAKVKAASDAAVALEMAAGTSLEALQGAMGAMGGACAACHKAYRAP